jgi:hypothetical protein
MALPFFVIQTNRASIGLSGKFESFSDPVDSSNSVSVISEVRRFAVYEFSCEFFKELAAVLFNKLIEL